MKAILKILILVSLVLAAQAPLSFSLEFTSDNDQPLIANLASMPLAFTQNRGQWDERVLFRAETGGVTFFFCENEVHYLFVREINQLAQVQSPRLADSPFDSMRPRHKIESVFINVQFIESNPNPQIVVKNRLSHNSNYFYGSDPAKWRSDVPNFSSIVYKDIYSGIDLEYYANGKSMKYDFLAGPGADISLIKLKYRGIENLSASESGDLRIQTSLGTVSEKSPYCYQQIDGHLTEIPCGYIIYSDSSFGFSLGQSVNSEHSIVIDPELVYATYLGGSGNDEGYAIALDSKGHAYVTGSTRSIDFPLAHPFDDSLGCYEDIFVTKISATGDQLIYSTFIGSADQNQGLDDGHDIKVDTHGNAYVTGYCGRDFPTLNAYDSTYNGHGEAYLLKLSAEGNSLIFNTYLGGASTDFGNGLFIDSFYNVYVTGHTTSSDFPTVNAYDASINDQNVSDGDVFISKFSAAGDSLIFSTFLGGNGYDTGLDLAADPSGNVYITGWTESTNFPVVMYYDSSLWGGSDAFVAKLSPGGDELIYSTYLVSRDEDSGTGIAVDQSGHAYVVGVTDSTGFPLSNAYDGSFGGELDAFLTKFALNGRSLVYSTYLGGFRREVAFDVCLDSIDCAYVTGYSGSSNFPIFNPYDGSISGCDVFITRFSVPGNNIMFSTFLGGSGFEEGHRIAVNDFGDIYVAGYTYSNDFYSPDAFDTTFDGFSDAFAARITMLVSPIADQDEVIPRGFTLIQNFPNPFNNSTSISYALPKDGQVSLKIYDILGRCIETIANESQAAGFYQYSWNSGSRASGLYFYRIVFGGLSETKKMVLLK